MNLYRCLVAAAAAILLSSAPAANAGTTVYKYDVHGRLVEVDYPNGTVVIYTYDNAGNRTKVVKTP